MEEADWSVMSATSQVPREYTSESTRRESRPLGEGGRGVGGGSRVGEMWGGEDVAGWRVGGGGKLLVDERMHCVEPMEESPRPAAKCMDRWN